MHHCKTNVNKFVESATAEDLQRLEAAVVEQEAKAASLTVDDAVAAVKHGHVDLAALKSAICHRRHADQRAEDQKRYEADEQAREAAAEAVRTSTEFLALAGRVKALRAEYEALNGKTLSVTFSVPVTATVTLDELRDFDEFFGEDFRGHVEDVGDMYSPTDFTLALQPTPDLTEKQVESVQHALNDLSQEYSCEMVTALFPNAVELVDAIFQKAKAVVIDFDKMNEQVDIDMCELLDE